MVITPPFDYRNLISYLNSFKFNLNEFIYGKEFKFFYCPFTLSLKYMALLYTLPI